MYLSKVVPSFIQKLFVSSKHTPMLGRWSLKHGCSSESIVVLNANRDHCGDSLCGDPNEYKKLVKTKDNI